MLGITMNFDISTRLTPQRSTIICNDMKYIINRKKKRYKTMGGLGKPWQEKMTNTPQPS